eukprot:g3609.t1
MKLFLYALCISCLRCVTTVLSYEFSQATRVKDIALLENLTLPIREKMTRSNDHTFTLVDFLASSVGLRFLNSHEAELKLQKRLEREYRREAICRNLKNTSSSHDVKKQLSSEEKRFRSCVCSSTKPYLHCLAIGSQLLRVQGYEQDIKVMDSSSSIRLTKQRAVLSALTPSTNEDASSPSSCSPHFVGDEKQLCYGGHCNIPVGKILDIKIDDLICSGDDEVSSIDMKACKLCIPSRSPRCHEICKDDGPLLENMITTGVGDLNVKICVNLGRIGSLIKAIFGGDNCFQGSTVRFHFYQRLLSLDINQGQTSFRVSAKLDYKYDNGPECICKYNIFRCIRSCKMKQEDVIGTLTVSWNYFFASGSYSRSWNEPDKCYTEFQRLLKECPT